MISVEYGEGLATIKCSGGRHNVLHVLEYLNGTETSFGRVFAEQPTLNDVFLVYYTFIFNNFFSCIFFKKCRKNVFTIPSLYAIMYVVEDGLFL